MTVTKLRQKTSKKSDEAMVWLRFVTSCAAARAAAPKPSLHENPTRLHVLQSCEHG